MNDVALPSLGPFRPIKPAQQSKAVKLGKTKYEAKQTDRPALKAAGTRSQTKVLCPKDGTRFKWQNIYDTNRSDGPVIQVTVTNC